MSEVKTQPVRAQLVESILDGPPGSIKFYKNEQHDPDGFHFQCPCGCKSIGAVKVSPGGWEWNGNREAPEVSPSVALHGHDGLHWHGWLTGGTWYSC